MGTKTDKPTAASHNEIDPADDPSTPRAGKRASEGVDGKTRIQVDLTEERYEKFSQMMRDCALDTKKDLFNNALSLLAWAIGEVKAGKHVASYEKTSKEIEIINMPIFDEIRDRRKTNLLLESMHKHAKE